MSARPADAVVYEGAVTHRRFKPKAHRLKYKVFSFLLDLDALDAASARLRFFSRNRFNLFSFYDKDHGTGRATDLAADARRALADAGVDAAGRILLLCYPRMLGYAFNPLSVYYCYDARERLAALIYEVNNTFGERHAYLIPWAGDSRRIDQSADKTFHVSPFIDMDMRYRFSLSHPEDEISVFIETADRQGPVLNAAFAGAGGAITDKKLVSLFFRYPLMTVKVVVGIYWEALKLIAKGVRLRAGGPAPSFPITVARPDSDQTKSAA